MFQNIQPGIERLKKMHLHPVTFWKLQIAYPEKLNFGKTKAVSSILHLQLI